ncbi:MAG: hypothetical protein GVY13_05100 [Alphaproteobacteria bacterium]|jgi:surface antigen|nr:hypothetical protein [Alphaproteobacteria bacterium]
MIDRESDVSGSDLMRRTSCVLVCAFALGTAGCNTLNNQQVGTGVGGAVGATLGAVIGNELGGTTGAIIAGIGGGVLGGLIGGEIGRQLDEADRERASQATLQALERSEVEVASAPRPAVRESLPTSSRPRRQPEAVVSSSPVVAWDSDENEDVNGTAQVVDAEVDTANRECRTVREIAYIGGEEIAQNTRYCRDPEGSGWTKVA